MYKSLQGNPILLNQFKNSQPIYKPHTAAAPPASSPWQLIGAPPGFPALSNPLLLTDGSVIFHNACASDWWKLTPDQTGGYVNGTWSQIASLPAGYGPLYIGSGVLPDGRVMAEGGEYNNNGASCSSVWTTLGAIYDPLANSWTAVTPPSGWSNIGDAQTAVLPNGTYMQGNCCANPPLSSLLNPTTLGWTATGTGKVDYQDEEGWTLLPNGNVLTVDVWTCNKSTEVYSPGNGSWTPVGNTVAELADCTNPGSSPSYEIGPALLRPDGTVVAFGGLVCSSVANTSCANGTLSVVDPTGIFNSSTSTWSAGPNIPAVGGQNYSLDDAPVGLEPSGTLLFAASPSYQYAVSPTHFFEFSVAPANAITQVADNTDASGTPAYVWNFLVLPTGQILASNISSNVWIYTPTGSPNAAWAPNISSGPPAVVLGASYTVSGSQLNGLSQGAAFGDDDQSATNYPIARITNASTGHVFYGRTYNHSTMTVAPNASGSTHLSVPANLEVGPSSMVVIANGIASKPVSVNVQHSAYAKQLDFAGDHRSDILWRCVNTGASCTDGTMAIWEMNGGSITASVGGQTISNGWQIVATGDFNGDSNTDIVWRCTGGSAAGCTDGTITIWEMNGGSVIASVGGQVVPQGWTIVGTGDFDGDGKSDILWRCTDTTGTNCTNGTVTIWEMNGGTITASVGGQVIPAGWSVVGLGDFNGDGKADILWRCIDPTGTTCTTGTVLIWEMNGGSVIASVGGQVVPAGYTIVGTGDFNADGKSDILWRCTDTSGATCTNGTVVIWEMNGGSILASVGGQVITPNWQIEGVGDFNGDGLSDILWRCTDASGATCTNGTVVIWEMNGGSILASVGGQVVSSQWALVQ